MNPLKQKVSCLSGYHPQRYPSLPPASAIFNRHGRYANAAPETSHATKPPTDFGGFLRVRNVLRIKNTHIYLLCEGVGINPIGMESLGCRVAEWSFCPDTDRKSTRLNSSHLGIS